MRVATLIASSLLVLLLAAPAARADTLCTMNFDVKGWSLFYKSASGSGTIECADGQKASVSITAKGGGITVGKTEIPDGLGKFTAVSNIDDLFGLYVAGSADAGAGRAASAGVMTKGNVYLAFAGTGNGTQLGWSFGKFVIEKK